jgi:hypothetical protein
MANKCHEHFHAGVVLDHPSPRPRFVSKSLHVVTRRAGRRWRWLLQDFLKTTLDQGFAPREQSAYAAGVAAAEQFHDSGLTLKPRSRNSKTFGNLIKT